MKLARNATIFGIIASALYVLASILYIFWNLKNSYGEIGFFIIMNLIHFIAAALLLVFFIMMCVYYNKRLSED